MNVKDPLGHLMESAFLGLGVGHVLVLDGMPCPLDDAVVVVSFFPDLALLQSHEQAFRSVFPPVR